MEAADHQYKAMGSWGGGAEVSCTQAGDAGDNRGRDTRWDGSFCMHLRAAFIPSKGRHLCYQMAFTSPLLPALSLTVLSSQGAEITPTWS